MQSKSRNRPKTESQKEVQTASLGIMIYLGIFHTSAIVEALLAFTILNSFGGSNSSLKRLLLKASNSNIMKWNWLYPTKPPFKSPSNLMKNISIHNSFLVTNEKNSKKIIKNNSGNSYYLCFIRNLRTACAPPNFRGLFNNKLKTVCSTLNRVVPRSLVII